MGYRSEVAISIYGDVENMVNFEAAYNAAYEELDSEAKASIDDFMTYDDNGFNANCTAFKFHLDSVKWYELYNDVAFLVGLLSIAEDCEVNSEFVRIGEDYDDIETEYSGENVAFNLGVARSIVGI